MIVFETCLIDYGISRTLFVSNSLLQLYPDPSLRPESRNGVVERLDVIVIPGVSSSRASNDENALSTVTASTRDGRERNWLKDDEFLPYDLPDSRVLLYSYDACKLFTSFSLDVMTEVCEELLKLLVEYRRVDPHRPLIILAHSLGGIVAKHAFMVAHKDARFSVIKNVAKGFVFFGTPNQSDWTESSLRSTITTILTKLDPMRGFIRNSLPSQVKKRASMDSFYQNNANDYLQSTETIYFYECIGSIVPMEENMLPLTETISYSLDALHRNMCRFTSRDSTNYRTVSRLLVSLADRVLSSDPERKYIDRTGAHILRKLSDSNRGREKHSIKKHTPDTCTWILNHPKFVDWSQSHGNSFFWLSGRVGSGKSVLARFVIDTLDIPPSYHYGSFLARRKKDPGHLTQSNSRVLFFFLSHEYTHIDDKAVLRSLLHQLLSSQPSLFTYISHHDRMEFGQKTTPSSKLGRLLAEISAHVKIYVVIDGLDELNALSQSELLDALSIGRYKPGLERLAPHGHLKVLFTSRDFTNSQLDRKDPTYEIDLSSNAIEYTKRDIELFVRSELAPNLKSQMDIQRMDIIRELSEKAQGMFLWATLAINALEHPSFSLLEIFLGHATLPDSLDDTYSFILSHLKRKHTWDVTRRVLQWVACSSRPLSITELEEAVLFDIESCPPVDIKSTFFHHVSLFEDAVSVFLTTDQDERVSFLHKSVKEFLMSRSSEIFQVDIGRTCMSYLLREPSQSCSDWFGKGRDIYISDQLAHKHPLFRYASIYWSQHVRQFPYGSECSLGLAIKLSNPETCYFRRWFPLYWQAHTLEGWERTIYPKYPTNLIVLAFLGDTQAVQQRLNMRTTNIHESTRSGPQWTPLMAAAWMGHEDIVEILLNNGAGQDTSPEQNSLTLVHTIERGHIQLVQKLVTRLMRVGKPISLGTSCINVPTPDGGITPLFAATNSMEWATCRFLLAQGADPSMEKLSNSSFRQKKSSPQAIYVSYLVPRTPFQTAAFYGNLHMMRLMLEVNSDLDFSMALQFTVLSGNISTMQFLLNHGVDINCGYNDEFGQTPLHLAAATNNLDIVEFLLSSGADSSLVDVFGATSLDYAASWGSLELVKSLSRSWNIAPHTHKGLLIRCCRWGNHRVAEHLINYTDQNTLQMTIDAAYASDDSENAVARRIGWPQLFFYRNRARTLELLLSTDVDPFRISSDGNNLFHRAVIQGDRDIIFTITKTRGAPIRSVNHLGRMPLQIAIESGALDVFEKLIVSGADILQIPFSIVVNSGSALLAKKFSRENYLSNMLALEKSVWFHSNNLRLKMENFCSIENVRNSNFDASKEFLRQRKITNLQSVRFPTYHSSSYVNSMKCWFEEATRQQWIWWPFEDPLRVLGTGKAWIEWRCDIGKHHREAISVQLAQDIQALISFQEELKKIVASYRYVAEIQRSKHKYDMEGNLCGRTSTGTPHNINHTEQGTYGSSCNPKKVQKASRGLSQSSKSPTTPPPQPPPPPPPPPTFLDQQKKEGPFLIYKSSHYSIPENLDTSEYNTDFKIFGEMNTRHRLAKCWLKTIFSIWRFHHYGCDQFTRFSDNVVTSKSTGVQGSIHLPPVDHPDYIRTLPNGDHDEPISQQCTRAQYYACLEGCKWSWWFFHHCSAPKKRYSVEHHLSKPGRHFLDRMPKRKEPFDPYTNYGIEVYGMTAFDLPSFFGFFIYVFLLVGSALVFAFLWLARENRGEDLQNAFVPCSLIVCVITLIYSIFPSTQWNTNQAQER